MDQFNETIMMQNKEPRDCGNEKNKINETATSDLAASVQSDSSSFQDFREKKYLVELNDVFKCTLCEAVLVGDVSVCKHLRRTNHKTREKIYEDQEAHGALSKTILDFNGNLSREEVAPDNSFHHSSPKSCKKDSVSSSYFDEKCSSISESLNTISSRLECMNSSLTETFEQTKKIFNSTELPEKQSGSEPTEIEQTASGELSTVYSEPSTVSKSFTSDEINHQMTVHSEMPSLISFQSDSGFSSIPLETPYGTNRHSSSDIHVSLSTISEDESESTLNESFIEYNQETGDNPDDQVVETSVQGSAEKNIENLKNEYNTSETDDGYRLSVEVVDKSCTDDGHHLSVEVVDKSCTDDGHRLSAEVDRSVPDLEQSEKMKQIELNTVKPELETFGCSNCNFQFPSAEELFEHIEIEQCMAQNDSCDSDIDVDTLKALVKLKEASPKHPAKKHPKTVISNLFPQPYCKENYIKRFLQDGAENVLNGVRESIHSLKTSLDLSFVTAKEVRCLICNETCVNDVLTYYEHFRSERHVAAYHLVTQNQQPDANNRSTYELAINKLVQVSKNGVQCVACNESFGYYQNKITSHTNSRTHSVLGSIYRNRAAQLLDSISKKLSEIWYDIERYWCEPCNLKFFHEIHFSNHLETYKHKQNTSNKKLVFDVCIPCGSLWLGLPFTYGIHNQILIHKYMIDHKIHEVNKVPDSVESLIKGFEVNLRVLEDDAKKGLAIFAERRDELIGSIDELLRPHFPEVKITLLGSRVTGTCCSLGAIDINLTFGYKNVVSESCFLSEVQNYFIERPELWDMECVMFRDEIPVIHVYHVKTKLKCNVSISDELGVEKTNYIKMYIDLFPKCKELIIYLKRWNFLCALWHPKGINAYTITWLVVFYLQQIGILPSVHQVMNKRYMSHFGSGRITELLSNHERFELTHLSVKQLLIGYFKFYSNFDYKEMVICPLLGNDVRKEVFITGRNVPPEMLFNQSAEQFSNSFHVESPMCLQDPFESKQNLTKNVSKPTLREFRYYCAGSAQLLENHFN